MRTPRSSASFRHKSIFWKINGIRLERGEKLDWSLLRVDTEDFKTVPPSESHVKNFESNEVDIEKETMILCSHAGRATSCKKDSRHPALCTKL